MTSYHHQSTADKCLIRAAAFKPTTTTALRSSSTCYNNIHNIHAVKKHTLTTHLFSKIYQLQRQQKTQSVDLSSHIWEAEGLSPLIPQKIDTICYFCNLAIYSARLFSITPLVTCHTIYTHIIVFNYLFGEPISHLLSRTCTSHPRESHKTQI